MKGKFITLLFLQCLFVLAYAQKEKGSVSIGGYVIHTDSKGKQSPLENININVYQGTEIINNFTTNKKGRFDVSLPFGYQYKVVFENNDEYIDMSFAVDGKVPPQKENISPSVSLDVPMFEKGTSEVDTLKFKFPFTKFKFDGNKKFIDDQRYLSEFQRGLFKEYRDAQKQIKIQKAEKLAQAKLDAKARFILVGGKLLAGNPPTLPLKNMKINLVSEKGLVVETSTTDKYGNFSFSKLALDRNYSIKLDENDADKLIGTKITMYNKFNKEVLVTRSDEKGGFLFKILASDKIVISELEVIDNSLFIAGTLEALLNGKQQAVSQAKIVLANSTTGSVFETVETDAKGNFVFSKLPPNKNFVVRLEDSNAKLAAIKITMKDWSGKEIKSDTADGFGKFRFQFLKGDPDVLNNLQVDENTLKMDLVGRFLLSDEKSTPLSSVKIDLLDDAGLVLQSTTTSENGMFIFNNLTLYDDYFFRLDSADSKIKTASSVVLSNKTAKPVKEYKLDSTQEIKYRFLPSDQKKLAKLYMK